MYCIWPEFGAAGVYCAWKDTCKPSLGPPVGWHHVSSATLCCAAATKLYQPDCDPACHCSNLEQEHLLPHNHVWPDSTV